MPRPRASRWTSFVADPGEDRPRILSEEGNPAHRLRVEHNATRCSCTSATRTARAGPSWPSIARTRRWAVAQARRQREAAEDAYARLYADA